MKKAPKYKLIKDLPDLPAGAVFTRHMKGIKNVGPGDDYLYARRKPPEDGWVYMFSVKSLDSNKEWFKRI